MATAEKATVLRRVAQLIEDLQALELLGKKDVVDFKYNDDNSICIIFKTSYSFYKIKRAFYEEFGEDKVYPDINNDYSINFKISYDR